MKMNIESQTQYPFDGEMFYPSNQKFRETIVLTHYYGGHKNQLKRYIQYLNSIGFKVYTFNLFPQPFKSSFHLLINPKVYFKRLSSIWKRQCLQSLKSVPGDKIVYSLSFSCNITSQLAHQDSTIKALIFDGGPFAEPIKSSWLYLTHQEKISSVVLRSLVIIPWNLFFNFFSLKRRLYHSLKKLESGFPILSFRAEDDLLVPSQFIDNILKPHAQLNLTTVMLKNTKHLQGLKVDSELYTKYLRHFLEQNTTVI